MFSILAVSCGQNQSDRSRVDHAIHAMNNRQYDEAVSILESVYAENPAHSSNALLLAQAHLGKAGFEMMGLIEKVAGAQENVDPDQYWVDQPHCDSGPIEKIAGYDVRCLIFRLMNNLPDAEDPSLIRARNILRSAFKDPAQTPSDANFLSALVEFSSAFYRIREFGKTQSKVLLEQEPNDVATADQQFKLVSHHLKRFLIETHYGFKRLRYSYGKLARIVKSMDGKPMVTIGDRTLMFSDNLDTADILRFASVLVQDRAEGVDSQISDFVGQGIRVAGIKYMGTLARLDRAFFSRDQLEELSISWKFNHATAKLLEWLAASDSKDFKFKPAMLLWDNPPIIFREFRDAIESGWTKETVGPLWDYFLSTRDRWNELGHIMDDWGAWYNNELTFAQRSQIEAYLREAIHNDRNFTNLPERIRTETLEKYGQDLTEAMIRELGKILSGQAREIKTLNSDQMNHGQLVLKRTISWINANLWHVSQ